MTGEVMAVMNPEPDGNQSLRKYWTKPSELKKATASPPSTTPAPIMIHLFFIHISP